MQNLDVLAHPTRLRVLRHLAEHGPAGAVALADAAGVHRNTIRRHLRALEQAGVLVATPGAPGARGARGRPVVEYRLADEAGAGETDFRRLAELLVTALARLQPDDDELRHTGEDWGRYLVGRPGAHEPRERLDAVLAELGFRVGGDERNVELNACPCPIVSPDRPEMVCRLVNGVIAGALAAAGSPLRPDAEQHDPTTRHCVVHLAGSL